MTVRTTKGYTMAEAKKKTTTKTKTEEVIADPTTNEAVIDTVTPETPDTDKAEPQKVAADILEYLMRLHDQRALDFSSGKTDGGANTK